MFRNICPISVPQQQYHEPDTLNDTTISHITDNNETRTSPSSLMQSAIGKATCSTVVHLRKYNLAEIEHKTSRSEGIHVHFSTVSNTDSFFTTDLIKNKHFFSSEIKSLINRKLISQAYFHSLTYLP